MPWPHLTLTFCHLKHILSVSFQVHCGGVQSQNDENCVNVQIYMGLTVYPIYIFHINKSCTELLSGKNHFRSHSPLVSIGFNAFPVVSLSLLLTFFAAACESCHFLLLLFMQNIKSPTSIHLRLWVNVPLRAELLSSPPSTCCAELGVSSREETRSEPTGKYQHGTSTSTHRLTEPRLSLLILLLWQLHMWCLVNRWINLKKKVKVCGSEVHSL